MAKRPKPKGNGAGRTSRRRPEAKPPVITDKQVRLRAYEIYLARGRVTGPGDQLSDWLQAKQELYAEAGHPMEACATT